MIIHAEIISQPYSGEFKERIYDIQSFWNSQNWTFVKFMEDDHSEWCGQFRGFPKNVQISNKHELILILTSDYLFQLNAKTAEVSEFEEHPQYQNLTLTPDQNFLIADYMNIEKITNNIKEKKLIKSPFEMDLIEFKEWNENVLEFICDEFVYWDKHYLMTYNNLTDVIEITDVL